MIEGLNASVELRLGDLDLRVDLQVGAGETVAILGPNAAGKTTLLRAIAGLAPLDRGRVTLDGIVLEEAPNGRRVPPNRRPIGVAFQDYVLFPHLNALDNVAFGLRARGVTRREANERAARWLDLVGLRDRTASRVGELSGGQAQRVSLARALAIEPRLLLLDEPLAALDATTRLATRRDLRRHLAAYEGTRLVVTHDPIEAIALADRLVVIEVGRVVQEGTPAEITGRPRSAYVADLVGVNLYRGVATGDHVAIDKATVTIAEPASGEVFLVIHPRSVALHRRAPEGSARNVWAGTTSDIDMEGERARVRVRGALPIVAEVTSAAVRDLGLAEGLDVWLTVKATEVSVYPA